MKRIWGIRCSECKKRLFSFWVHDYKVCGCSNGTMIDGGREYQRWGYIKTKPKSIYWSRQDGKYPNIKKKGTWPY